MSDIELVQPPQETGPVAPLVAAARALVLQDPQRFEAVMAEIRARIQAEVGPFIEAARAVEITDAASYAACLGIGKRAVGFIRRIGELLDPLSEEFYRPWKNSKELLNSFTKPLEEVKTAVTDKAKKWDRAERARVEAQRRAAEEAKQKVADDLAAKGKPEAAAAVLKAEIAPPVAQAPKVDGVTPAAHWTWELQDFAEVLLGVQAGTVPKEVLTLDTAYLNRVAPQVKDTVSWRGLRFYDEGSIRFRT